SQLVRSPGVYFDRNRDRTTDKEVFGAKIIPSRGAWLEFEIDKRDVLGVRVDRKRKQSAIVFLEAIGMTKSEIKESFQGYPLVLDALEKESIDNQDAALTDLYRKIRPSDTATPEAGRNLLDSFYFNTKRYDLARVGRYKINRKLGLEADFDDRSLNRDDIIATIKYLVTLHAGDKTFPGSRNGEAVDLRVDVDDIDHFGNRRIRQVGELIQNQLRTGLSRMERVVRERMTTQDAEAITPQSLINIRPVNATIKEFFGTSQLSQFMDQNNPLAGVTNKRRLSALGPGGLSRDRASMEVRDVHPSHFGRMCPIESPEGPNIGLIGSLATFGRINPFGFIETPYRKVDNGQLTDEITYMTADQEADHVIAQANQIIDDKGHLVESTALVRDSEGEAEDVPVDQVDYMDVSPRQMVSLGASLIPFLEHDEGHRALMGTNMQRQAVPLIKSERPLVGTGSEWRAAVDSGDVILADKPGVVTYVSGDIIRVLNDDGTQSSYKLSKFQRSNQTTCYNQVPTIKDGERVEAGSVLADGPATQNGEMALGKNLLVAFMPWNGYNYEDAVIISQRLVQDDTLSSIHIEEYEIDARETKLGSEEITRDLPNVGEDAVANLDERGVIRIGAEVEAGDILVGKVTPKGETELTPEERLLRAIFGEKSREVRDTSLRVPHGETGTVIAVKEISREDAEEDGDELPNGVNQMIRVYIAQHRKITQGDKLSGRHGNKGVISRILPEEDMPFLPDGTPIDIMLNPLGVPSRMNLGQVLELHLGWIAHAGWDINIDPDLEAEWKKHIPAGAEKADPDTPVASPVFDGVRQDALHGLLKTTLPNRDGEHLVGDHGKAVLYDGRTGEPFTKPISVGYMYMLKLHHLVDDKIHARSTGPYSMITQQPLGGKAQFGGQRFGEMEVWALEAYGAAYTLHEMMTTKSDDVDGRVRVYGAIVKGDNLPPAGIPESFKVLLKEMQSLSLNVEVLNAEGVAIDMKDEDDDPASASNDLGFNIGARPDAGAAMSSNDSEPEYR
ncbi:MAG: DNA-directed RNA polymerase subunit beta, partial [Bifidobacterium crudilactis]